MPGRGKGAPESGEAARDSRPAEGERPIKGGGSRQGSRQGTVPCLLKGGRLAGLVGQARRYLIVGFASAAIDFGLFALLYNLLGVTLVVNVLGFDLLVSNVAAIVASTVFNFLLSRSWTFGSVSSLPRSVALYLALFVLNQLFASAAILWLTGLGAASPLAKLSSMACIVCWNFFLYRKMVFR